jgi:hypothetical protein
MLCALPGLSFEASAGNPGDPGIPCGEGNMVSQGNRLLSEPLFACSMNHLDKERSYFKRDEERNATVSGFLSHDRL